jgi:transposase
MLAFCWAHQRRDFVELAHVYPACEPWAFEWVGAIGELYHLNAMRLQTPPDSAQANLQESVQRLADSSVSARWPIHN